MSELQLTVTIVRPDPTMMDRQRMAIFMSRSDDHSFSDRCLVARMFSQDTMTSPPASIPLMIKGCPARRFGLFLMSIFGGIGLVLVTIGVYGVLAHGTARRTHEIGIRLAGTDSYRDGGSVALSLVVR